MLRAADEVTFTDGTTAPYGGSVTATADGLDLRRGTGVIRFRWGTPRTVTFGVTSVPYLRDGSRRLHVLRIPHSGTITVKITLNY